MNDPLERLSSSIRSSQMLRLATIGLLALLLQIPILMISGLVHEREARRSQAVAEVSSKWGELQTVTGPALVVPYERRVADARDDLSTSTRTETRHAVFLPRTLRIRGGLDAHLRHRGIFSIPVYSMDLRVEGEFDRPDFAQAGIDPVSVAWDEAELVVGIADARAIQRETKVTWSGGDVPFEPGVAGLAVVDRGIHARVGIGDTDGGIPFSFPLALDGSTGVYFTPFAESTLVELQADYPHPSFQGNWLPTERSVSDGSFEATWSIPYFGRNYAQAWPANAELRGAIGASHFGVELIDPVDQYRMADRSVKYAGLFIVLTFAAVWLIEVLAGVRVHPIQYLMLGAALCMFYLLELSLSEHLGFALAYAIASLSVVGLIAGYALVMFQRSRRALVVVCGVSTLYAMLYVLLLNEEFALLIGSIGLFLILAAIMYATRGVDWYSLEAPGLRQPVNEPLSEPAG